MMMVEAAFEDVKNLSQGQVWVLTWLAGPYSSIDLVMRIR
jgi:hypothetical protein